jgi:hypothetical protein
MAASRRRVRLPTTAIEGGPAASAAAVTPAGILSLFRSSGTATAAVRPATAAPLTTVAQGEVCVAALPFLNKAARV